MTPSIYLIRIVFKINVEQFQTGPIHKSINNIFAKIPEVEGRVLSGPPVPHSGTTHGNARLPNSDTQPMVKSEQAF